MGKPQTPPLPLWLIGFRNETLKPSLYHILLPHLHSCVVIAQLSTGADMSPTHCPAISGQPE